MTGCESHAIIAIMESAAIRIMKTIEGNMHPHNDWMHQMLLMDGDRDLNLERLIWILDDYDIKSLNDDECNELAKILLRQTGDDSDRNTWWIMEDDARTAVKYYAQGNKLAARVGSYANMMTCKINKRRKERFEIIDRILSTPGMLPDEDSLQFGTQYAPLIIENEKERHYMMKAYSRIMDITGSIDECCALGFDKTWKLMHALESFPLQAYGLTRRKAVNYAIAFTNDDAKYDWLMGIMDVIKHDKPVIDGGFTIDWINANNMYPIEFSSEFITADSASFDYESETIMKTEKWLDVNASFTINAMRMLGVKPKTVKLPSWYHPAKPSPSMTETAIGIADKINHLDERIVKSFPSSLKPYNLWRSPYAAFDITLLSADGRFHSTDGRTSLFNAKSMLRNDSRTFRWAMIQHMMKYFHANSRASQAYSYNARNGIGRYLKDVQSNNKTNNISLSKEIRDYVNGKPLPAIIRQKNRYHETMITIPEPLLETLNAMPLTVDGIPDGYTGAEWFAHEFKRNIESSDNPDEYKDSFKSYEQVI